MHLDLMDQPTVMDWQRRKDMYSVQAAVGSANDHEVRITSTEHDLPRLQDHS